MCGVRVFSCAHVPALRAEALRDGASRFETTARKLKRNMWWKNTKVGRQRSGLGYVRSLTRAPLQFMIILIVVILVIIGLIVGTARAACP